MNEKRNYLTATQFITELTAFQEKNELENVRRFFRYEGVESKFLGIRMASIFALARQFKQMHLGEIEQLIESEYYEARMGAVSIMDFQARDKKTTTKRKKELFDLYVAKHNYINNWDLVDRSAPFVVGGYLFHKSRT